MQLAFYAQDDVQVLLGLDEVAEIRRHHLGHVRTGVGLRPHDMDGLGRGALVEGGLVVRIAGSDEVGLVDGRRLAVEHELEVLEAVLSLVH